MSFGRFFSEDREKAGNEDVLSPHFAAQKGYIGAMEFCLDEGVDINKESKNQKETPLFVAVRAGQVAMVEFLIKKGADVNKVSVDMTPLQMAVISSRLDIVRILLKAGANVDYRNAKNETVLDFAIKMQDEKLITCLQEHQSQKRSSLSFT